MSPETNCITIKAGYPLFAVGDSRFTLFLVDGLRSKITSQNIFLIIRDASMIGMVVVFLHYDGAQSLFCHMPLHPLDAAGHAVIIQYAAYFDSPVPLF